MSGGGRQTDVFQLNGGDVFSYLAANQRYLKISDVFYGIDGTTKYGRVNFILRQSQAVNWIALSILTFDGLDSLL